MASVAGNQTCGDHRKYFVVSQNIIFLYSLQCDVYCRVKYDSRFQVHSICIWYTASREDTLWKHYYRFYKERFKILFFSLISTSFLNELTLYLFQELQIEEQGASTATPQPTMVCTRSFSIGLSFDFISVLISENHI